MRSFDVKLEADGREGVVIPVSCIVEDDGRHGVYVLVGRTPHYRRVELLASNEESALVSGVPLGARGGRQSRRCEETARLKQGCIISGEDAWFS